MRVTRIGPLANLIENGNRHSSGQPGCAYLRYGWGHTVITALIEGWGGRVHER